MSETANDTTKGLTASYGVQLIGHAVAALQASKPNDRSEKDRRFAIVITELEKVQAIAEKFLKA